MTPEPQIQAQLGQQFFPAGVSVFAILDGASVPDLLNKLYEIRPEFECLYRGNLEPDMAEVAPYLVRLERSSRFTTWFIQQGWGKHWGIVVHSGTDITGLRRHFRRLLTVHDENAKPMLFRFYDPRVLSTYLPTCNGEEAKLMFGPVTKFIVESGESAVTFELQDGALRTLPASK